MTREGAERQGDGAADAGRIGRRAGAWYRRWRWVHGILGLVVAIPLLVQGLTGALLSYERELRNGLGDGAVEMSGPRLGLEALAERVSAQLGAGALAWAIWFEAETEPVWVRWRDGSGGESSFMFHPESGQLLERSTAWHRRFEWVLAIHRRLGAGAAGQVLMGSSALGLAVILASGLVLQFKRSRGVGRFLGLRRMRADRSGAGWWRWAHAALGTWMTPFLLVMALTGPVWSFAAYRSVIGFLTRSDPQYGKAPVFELEVDARVELSALEEAARGFAPSTGAMRWILPAAPGQPARFEWAPEDAPHENFRSRVWLHPESGAVLDTYLLSDYTRAERAVRWAYPLHIGRWGGGITQLLHFLAAAALPFFIASGLWLFWKRHAREPRGTLRQ